MARWESATDAQLEYVRALVERVRAQRDVVTNGTLDRGQASVVIDALRTLAGDAPPTNVVPIERASSHRDSTFLDDAPTTTSPAVKEDDNERYLRTFRALPRHVTTEYGGDYREPMRYRGRVVVYQRHSHRRGARGVTYGWAWVCKHESHTNPVHGGSRLGLATTIQNAQLHQWRFHRPTTEENV